MPTGRKTPIPLNSTQPIFFTSEGHSPDTVLRCRRCRSSLRKGVQENHADPMVVDDEQAQRKKTSGPLAPPPAPMRYDVYPASRMATG